jgi:hypothetical protein
VPPPRDKARETRSNSSLLQKLLFLFTHAYLDPYGMAAAMGMTDLLNIALEHEMGLGAKRSRASPSVLTVLLRGCPSPGSNSKRRGGSSVEFVFTDGGVLLEKRATKTPSTRAGKSSAGLSRAQGHTAKARAAYEDFLTVLEDADSDFDIPAPKQAESEYAKLQ